MLPSSSLCRPKEDLSQMNRVHMTPHIHVQFCLKKTTMAGSNSATPDPIYLFHSPPFPCLLGSGASKKDSLFSRLHIVLPIQKRFWKEWMQTLGFFPSLYIKLVSKVQLLRVSLLPSTKSLLLPDVNSFLPC
jgi:hypothetical protein